MTETTKPQRTHTKQEQDTKKKEAWLGVDISIYQESNTVYTTIFRTKGRLTNH
jgi:hypothetical protein